MYWVKVNVLLRKYSFMLAYVYSFIKPTAIPKALTFLCHSLTNLAREISSFIGIVDISVYKKNDIKSFISFMCLLMFRWINNYYCYKYL